MIKIRYNQSCDIYKNSINEYGDINSTDYITTKCRFAYTKKQTDLMYGKDSRTKFLLHIPNINKNYLETNNKVVVKNNIFFIVKINETVTLKGNTLGYYIELSDLPE